MGLFPHLLDLIGRMGYKTIMAEKYFAIPDRAVLYPNNEFAPWWGSIDQFVEKAVIPSGYRFFSWNGRLYELEHMAETAYKALAEEEE